MKAVRVHTFGGPSHLVYDEVPVPTPGPGEVLIHVHAAGVNPPDWYARTGFADIPAAVRPTDLRLPFTPGSDVSGVVAALGPDASGCHVGDAVFGLVRFPNLNNGGRCYAEYATAPTVDLAPKPETIDHARAAGVPMAALTAYQRLFDQIHLKNDQVVLVNGAAGGVGHFAVQLAKTRNAYVIGVASGRHEAFLRELGVDQFIDYTTTAVDQAVRDLDLVLDTVGGPAGHRFLNTLKPGGVLAPIFFGDFHEDRAAELGITFARGQVHSDGAQMAELARLIDAGHLRVGIDSVFSLADAAKAHERAAKGHIQGKIILTP